MNDDIFTSDERDGPFSPPIASTPDDVIAEIDADLAARIPQFQRIPGSGLSNLVGALGTLSAESRSAAGALFEERLVRLLGRLHGIPVRDGTPAESTVTFRAKDLAGHIVPESTAVWLANIELQTDDEATILAGADTVSVRVVTVDPGAEANGADGELAIDALDWLASVDAVTLDAPLANGTDPETPVEFEQRLAELLEEQYPKAILPEDLTRRALRHPQVGYAWTIARYDAETDETDKPFCATVVAMGPDGAALVGTAPAELRADLLGASIGDELADAVIRIVGPDHLDIPIDGDLVIEDGWDPDAALARARERLRTVLSPQGWVQAPYGLDPAYRPARVVHRNHLVAQAAAVEGVRFVPRLEIGDGSADYIVLATPTTLPRAGEITLAAVPPPS